ncbi:MAG: LPS export ABC transporter permease LptG [Desulfuromonas sp.]|nr:LPS export ABC transporter permease LptG [Desulfuromonas sp.]
MTIINRYLLTTFIRITMLALGVFVGIYLLVDFFEKVDDFLEYKAPISLYLYYFISKLPLIVSQVLPLTILMGVFMTLGEFSKSNELTAMRAGGISLFSLITPLIIATTLITGVHFTLNEYIVPAGVHNAEYILRTEVKGKTATLTKRDNLWFRDQNALYHINLVAPAAQSINGVSIYQLNDKLQLQQRIEAARVDFRQDRWIADTAKIRSFDPQSGQLTAERNESNYVLQLAKTPDDFGAISGDNDELNFSQLRTLSKRMQQEGLDATRYQVDMYARLATPFACLIMAFVAIPFALQKSRNINLALGISLSVLIGVAFYIIQSTLMAFGYSGLLPPFIAAWSANIIFFLLSAFLILSTRE